MLMLFLLLLLFSSFFCLFFYINFYSLVMITTGESPMALIIIEPVWSMPNVRNSHAKSCNSTT